MKTRDDLKIAERRRIEDLEIKVMNSPTDIVPKIELSTAFFSAGLFFDALNLLDEIDAHHFSPESYRLRLYYTDCFLIMFDPDNEHLQDEELREKFIKLYPFVKENISGGFFTDAYQARVLYKAFGRAYFIDLAYYFLRRAAELGHPSAQIDLALEYYHGGLFPKNHALAFAWTKKASDIGYSIGLNNLGNFYFMGVGTEIDYDLAFKYMHEAMLMGETISYSEIGYLYYHGLGTEKDIDKAIDIWETGASLGSPECMNHLNQTISTGQN